ncbi:hypothetical protein BN1723_019612 [Verticillium longisporum]|uniref:Uncharacterized protein n=1 Tax=Verticillium longisporum TaxID=100787 RepID=A0A0G4NF37_VERLO|nr:hypothetical protein BN1723_019612 [Verticillium longisporum]
MIPSFPNATATSSSGISMAATTSGPCRRLSRPLKRPSTSVIGGCRLSSSCAVLRMTTSNGGWIRS